MGRSPMRTAALLLLALLALPAGAAAQLPWLRDYQDGVREFERGNLALAEQKLKEAKADPRAPEQSRTARSGTSMFTEVFIPDYYLGLIAARQGRYQEAVKLLEGALAAGLVTRRQRKEFDLATTQLARSKEEAGKLAAARPPPEPSPSTPTPPPPSGPTGPEPAPVKPAPTPTPAPAAPPAWLEPFRRAIEAGRAALREGRFADARSSAAAARQNAGDQPSRGQADSLQREIDAAVAQEANRAASRVREALTARNVEGAQSQIAALEGLDPNHSALAQLRRELTRVRDAIAALAAVARAEREAIFLFFSGDYQKAAGTLRRAIGSGHTSPRIHLYLACSQAALALLSGASRNEELVQEARRQYALARPGENEFAADRRFISPKILELLNQ